MLGLAFGFQEAVHKVTIPTQQHLSIGLARSRSRQPIVGARIRAPLSGREPCYLCLLTTTIDKIQQLADEYDGTIKSFDDSY
jgi:hypothetical protein